MDNHFQEGNPNDSDEDNQSDEEVQEQQKKNKNKSKLQNKVFDSESEEEEKRVVKSEKDKRFGKMKEIIKQIKEKIRISDFSSLYNQFEELNKEFEKSKKVVEKEGIPLFYIRIIFQLENFLNNISSEDKKKLSINNNKMFNTLKHRLKKNNKNYEQQLAEFAKNPIPSSADEEKEIEKDSEEEDDDEDQDKIDNQDLDESEDDVEDIKKYRESNDPMIRRQFWLKKEVREGSSDSEGERKKDKDDDKKKREIKQKATTDKDKTYNLITLEERKLDLSPDSIIKRMKEIVDNMAKANLKELKEYFEDLVQYKTHFTNDIKKLEIILVLIRARFEIGKRISSSYLPKNLWCETQDNLREILSIIKKQENKQLEIQTFLKEKDQQYHNQEYVLESLCTYFLTLEGELYKSFKIIDYKLIDYSERISDLFSLLKLAKQAQEFYESRQDYNCATKIAFKRLENLYYFQDTVLQNLREKWVAQGKNVDDEIFGEQDTQKLIHNLAVLVYKYDEQNRVKANLYEIYHHCIHNRVSIARDYMLMSHISEQINSMDDNTRVIFNRVIVQMGLASFRLGQIHDAFTYLSEICGSIQYQFQNDKRMDPLNKIKELIAQPNKTQDKEERKRIIPYHMHINVETIETVFLTVTMLIEVPNNIYDSNNLNIKNLNKTFKSLLQFYEKNYFIGSPESNKDYIYYAKKALMQGNWSECYDLLTNLNIWTKINYADEAKKFLLQKVKEQSFKCYLFQYKNIFESVSIKSTSQLFALDPQIVKSITFKLILNKELQASIHNQDDDSFILFERYEKTKLQVLASNLFDKISKTFEQNENILYGKEGTSGFSQDNQQDQYKLNNKKNQKKKPHINVQGNNQYKKTNKKKKMH